MDIVRKLLRDIPLFRHCSDDEIGHLQKIARLASVKKGQKFDLKKTTSLNVVVYGLFEIETFAGSDVVHCAAGSFFGAIPLTGNRQRGTVRAMVDSSLLIMNEEDIYRFFLLSFKGLRGYQRAIRRAGFDISSAGEEFCRRKYQDSDCLQHRNGDGQVLLQRPYGHGPFWKG